MSALKVILILALVQYAATAEDPEKRPPRTIARFLGLEPKQQQQPQVVQQQPQVVHSNVPLVYNVKYYDRAGENPEVQVEHAQQQVPVQYQQQVPVPVQDRVVPSTRVFLNLYTGQQTPVYYDSKGQLYVPCPAYDHHHQVHSGGGAKPVVQKAVVGVGVGQQQQPVVYSGVGAPQEYVYYSGPQQQQQQQPVQKQQVHQHQQQRPVVQAVPPQPYNSGPVQFVPDILYYATQQQQQSKVVGYPPASTVVYNPYEVPFTFGYPTPYGYPGVVNPGHVVYQNGQGGTYPFVYVKPAQVTAAPGQQQQVTAHSHPQQQQQQQTDQVVVEKKNVSEKTDVK